MRLIHFRRKPFCEQGVDLCRMMWEMWWQGRRKALLISLDPAWKWWCGLRASWPALAHHTFQTWALDRFGRAGLNHSLALCFCGSTRAWDAQCTGLHPSFHLAQTQQVSGCPWMEIHPSSVYSEWFCSTDVCAYIRQHMAKLRNQHTNILGEAPSFCWVVTQQQASSLGSHLVIWHT